MAQPFIIGAGAPGIYANINSSQIGQPASPVTSDAFFLVVYSPWGPINIARNVTGLGDYNAQFGGLNANSKGGDAVYQFFRAGGRRALVCRVVGASAAVATHTFNDRAGSPVATIRVDAKYPSSSVDVRVTIEAGSTANTVKITARTVKLAGVLNKEVFDNVKLTFTQNELDAINSGQSTLLRIQDINEKSNLIVITNLNSATAAPSNLPALAAETTLTGGTDDFASIDAATFIGTDDGEGARTGLQVFNSEDYGTGQVALPGVTTNAGRAALATHADNFKRFAILDLAPGSDKDDALTARNQLDSSYAAIYFPPTVQMYDLAGSGQKKWYSPTGLIAAEFVRAEFEVGIHKAPANMGRLPMVLDVEHSATDAAQMDDNMRAFLNRNEINAIAPLPQQGIKIYGARVTKSYGRVTAIHEQRVLNTIYYELKRSYQEMPFAVVDLQGRIFREVKSISEQYLETLFRGGALTSASGKAEDSYSVICDSNNNPAQTLEMHQLNVEVGVHIAGMLEMLFINIDKVPLSIDLSVLQ